MKLKMDKSSYKSARKLFRERRKRATCYNTGGTTSAAKWDDIG